MKLKEFFIKNRETLQIIYGITLIVLIPILISFTTVFIINKYNQSLDVALQRQALTVGRSVYALIKNDLSDEDALQQKIKILSQKNTDFQDMAVLRPEGDDFKIVAAPEEKNMGKIFKSFYYKLAWAQPDNDGLATDSLKLESTSDGDELFADSISKDRFWLVAMPMSDTDGEKLALLSMKISSKIVDNLTLYNRNASIFLLVVTVLIVILFLSVAVRLWDYALLYKKIKEVDQMKDEFISIASHELRTPVTSIRGYTSMVLDGTFGEVNEKVKNNLKMVQGSSDRLAHLVEDLLNVSRIEQGRLKTDMKPTDISQVTRETIEELKVQADEKKLKLEYKPHAEKLPLINIDTERFKQILINLIGNAIKYTEKGKIKILTGVKNKNFVIRVKDTGMGMSAKDRERLFQKFYRVQNEKTKEITGTGLGLWVTKKIVEIMKGEITIDSIENVGTQVTLSFPIIKK
jgi:signal transduction histidine kinase